MVTFNQENTRNRIAVDLEILMKMIEAMAPYLDSMVVYYPLSDSTNKLSLGNYLMRQDRLMVLNETETLPAADRRQLDTAVAQFQQTVAERVVRVEQKGHEEAHIRVRQWGKAVSELIEMPEEAIPYYPTVVENRVMLAALIAYLKKEPYQFDEKLLADTAVIDQKLATIWQGGSFIWPDVWHGVYPINTHWWLYGQPTTHKN